MELETTATAFAYPWMLAAPIVALLLSRLANRRGVKTGVPLHPNLRPLAAVKPSLKLRLMRPTLFGLSTLTLLFLSLGAARPQRVRTVVETKERRSIMLVLDLSKSMTTEDFMVGFRHVSRLEAVKLVTEEFIRARTEDRLGLVVFGSGAFLQVPLTLDHALIIDMLERLEAGVAGDGTAIGDGIGLGLKRIEEVEGESKALVLMTDGVSNAGQVNPLQAAKVAGELKVKIHAIGVGIPSDEAERIPGGRPADFDAKTMEAIAGVSGGVYLHASSTEGLRSVYEQIDRLEGSKAPDERRQIHEELFARYALLALVCYALYLLLVHTVFMRIP